ncbi:DUF6478 family protein [Tropicimonas sp. TH_r6]|uniref:DUF6478 family protein n=1 Tax=Tropicimonas sp. TH_r6 TaxID=3082085 RepID=UPI002955BF08|nr:DUF6478 family protein [Tropicimonas sp. TH_r6]MDV7141336.1 DUF6478 family protein [Tropicimonas sp. TH_r6]
MAFGVKKLIGRSADQRSLEHWTRLADHAGSLDFSELKAARTRAGELRREIDRLCRAADGRMVGISPALTTPAEADWSWRPDAFRLANPTPGFSGIPSGTAVSPEITLYHDCKVNEISLRQVRNRTASDIAPFGLQMDVFRFDGSFLSLAVPLPEEATNGLLRRHLVGLRMLLRLERPLELFARVNVRHGPNTEQKVREIRAESGEVTFEFDLAYTEMNERMVEKAWLDLIFESPEMNQVEIRDMTMYRRPRAEM